MAMIQQVIVYGIKASKGTVEGRDFDSCIFHIQGDLKENSSGRSIGFATLPIKCGPASDFDKWAHLANSLPVKAEAHMEIQSDGKGGSTLAMISIKPIERQPAK